MVLGLNAATTLALSFSLVGTYKTVKGTGIDYTRYWRRAILSASVARAFGMASGARNFEDLFLAALLQDIAVIAIDRVQPDFYASLPKAASHADLIALEIGRFGMDHATLGAWLRNIHGGCCFPSEWSVTLPLWHIDALRALGRPSPCYRVARP